MMPVPKKQLNKILNLIKKKKPLELEEKKFLYEYGEINFDIIADVLKEDKFQKMHHKRGAITLLYHLRNFNRNKEFLGIVKEFLFDNDINVRSYCFAVLTTLIKISEMECNGELQSILKKNEIYMLLKEAREKGINTDTIEMAEKFLG